MRSLYLVNFISAPLTSFDWNEVDPNLLGTSSIDTTCTVWGLETGQVRVYTCTVGFFDVVRGSFDVALYTKPVYLCRCWAG